MRRTLSVTLSRSYPDTHWQGIDKYAKRTVEVLTALHPAKQNRAEDHIRVPRDPRQNLGKGRMEKARRAHTKSSRPLPHLPGKNRVEI